MPAVTANLIDLPRLAPATGRVRTIKSITDAPSSYEGEGFPVRRAFAGVPFSELDPFIHMDQMGEVEYAPLEPKGTAWHPHRGFETFTYMIDGQFQHQDNHGGGGLIQDGATQYMTAGAGILHIETPPAQLVMSGGMFHGIQLWINLPGEKKMISPAYQNLEGGDVTMVASQDGGSLVRILAGELAGFTGPGKSQTPMTVAHVTVYPGSRISLPWNPMFNALAYVLAGKGSVGEAGNAGDSAAIKLGNLAVLGAGDRIVFSAAHTQDSRDEALEIFLIGGKPIRQPVFAYGPFVMNTKAEVIKAMEDFQGGRFGQIPPDAIQPFRPGHSFGL